MADNPIESFSTQEKDIVLEALDLYQHKVESIKKSIEKGLGKVNIKRSVTELDELLLMVKKMKELCL